MRILINMQDWSVYMEQAITLAAQAQSCGDVPVGALVVAADGTVLAKGQNTREISPHDPTGHAEINALRAAAAKRDDWHLQDCTLIVTLEPCTMCAAAAVHARVARIVFGAWDEKAGACGSLRDVVRDTRNNHRPEVIGGVAAAQAQTQLLEFFRTRRKPLTTNS